MPEDTKLAVIEPLNSTKHDRTAFSCGIAQVDNFFRRTANKLAKADNVLTFVMVGLHGKLIGFYAVNAHAIDYTELLDRFARNRPAHGTEAQFGFELRIAVQSACCLLHTVT